MRFLILAMSLAVVAATGCAGGSRSANVPVGEEGVLDFSSFVPDVEYTPVFATVAALDKFVAALAAKDRYGYREALQMGSYLVRQRTQVQVIGHAGLGKREVRILEGQFAGTAGFVLSEWVRKR